MTLLHLGCTPWVLPMGGGAAELLRQAQLAERLGYESFWLPESHFNGAGAIPDPLMLLAAVAAGTQTIRLATTSYLLPLRHPLQAAEQVAVLDRLSGGRVILGVGRGFAPSLFEAFGVVRSEKRAIFAQCLTQMRDAWAGLPVGGASARLSPLPLQQPHPPVWVAAFGPKALAQAGALGLPYLASPMESLASLRHNYAHHRAACAAADLPLPPDVPVMRTVFVSEDPGRLARARELLAQETTDLRRQRGLNLAAAASIDDWAMVGTSRQVALQIGQYREQLGLTHLIVTRLALGGLETAEIEDSLAALAALAA